MTRSVWPQIVEHLLVVLPTLPEWAGVTIYDTDPISGAVDLRYAVVARTSSDTTSGSFVRNTAPSMLISENGTVRFHIVAQSGSGDASITRDAGFALADAFIDYVDTHQNLDGVLGALGTASVTVDVVSVANSSGVAQSLIVSINYTSLTPPS